MNLRGAPFLSDRPAVAHLQLAEYDTLKRKGATTLDVRSGALFDDGHAVDSLNIGIASPSFSVWSGFFVNPICRSHWLRLSQAPYKFCILEPEPGAPTKFGIPAADPGGQQILSPAARN